MSTIPRPAVQNDTFIPKFLLPIEQAQVIFDMLDAGCTKEELLAEHLAYMQSRTSSKRVRPGEARLRLENILLNKWRYCPDIDQVAVERAYDGDRDAWVALTHYERSVVLDRLYETRETKPHRMWPDAPGNGISEWARSVGESPDRVIQLLRRGGPSGSRRRA